MSSEGREESRTEGEKRKQHAAFLMKNFLLAHCSGCGKSTIASLLLRLYDTTGGRIEVGGSDIKELKTEVLRETVAVVQQEPVLFGVSIRENIAYGKDDATEEEVMEAARAAKVIDFANTFPNGLETMVGERGEVEVLREVAAPIDITNNADVPPIIAGVMLSGGQKQRVAVARVLLRKAPVVVFDEATSALDAESEFAVSQAIESLMEGRTVVSIAHRLATIKMAGRVAVLRGGKVVEVLENVGSLDEEALMNDDDSAFAALVRRQLGKIGK